ncbi:MAG: hypothetical protein WCS34_09545 [Bacteroidales bacterium]
MSYALSNVQTTSTSSEVSKSSEVISNDPGVQLEASSAPCIVRASLYI